MCRLEGHVSFFRLLMKGIFGPYVLRPFEKKIIFQLVTHIRTRNYTLPVLASISLLYWNT